MSLDGSQWVSKSLKLSIIKDYQQKTNSIQRNETVQQAYYKFCMKSDHPNVGICPRRGIFKMYDIYRNKKNNKILKYKL